MTCLKRSCLKKVKALTKIYLGLFLGVQFYALSWLFPAPLEAGTLMNTKDLLSNSRLSFSAQVSGSHPAGSSQITLNNFGPDTNTNHLFPGDVVKIGANTQGINLKTVAAVLDTAHFTLDSALETGINSGDSIIATQSALHTVSFTTATAVSNGVIRVLIPAAAVNNNDGRPDTSGFDLGGLTGKNITCPTGSVDHWETPTASASGTNRCLSGFSCFECRFSGTLPENSVKNFIVGDTNKKLINPAPSTKHLQGTADIYTTILYLYSYSPASGLILVDSTRVKTAVIESVQVSTNIESTLTFSVEGISANQIKCGLSTSVTTTTDAIPFGAINAAAFKQGGQLLTISTNAPHGYSVTIEEDSQMGLDGGIITKIPDTACDDGNCTHEVKANWNAAVATTTGAYGLGYSLENVSGADAAFTYHDWQTFLAKQIPCTSKAETCGTQDTSQVIMFNKGPVSGKSVNVCYRLNVAASQMAGIYWNKVRYVATPIF